MILAIAAAAAFAFALASDVYDIDRTLKVVDKGLALEANSWLVGPKPTHRALYLRDALVFGLAAAPYAVTVLVHAAAGAAPGMLAIPVVLGIKHIKGGKDNANVLAGQKPSDPNQGPARSWLYKFFHNW